MKIDLGPRPTVHADVIEEKGGHGMGRLPFIDPRNANYRYRATRRQLVAAYGVDRRRTSRVWRVESKRLPVDQGSTPRCVGYSIATIAAVGPNTQSRRLPTRNTIDAYANRVYMRALQLDPWQGEDPNFGTSVGAGMEAAVEDGLFGSYLWGENVADAADFVLNFGPAEFGTIWPDSMMRTDRNGYLNIDPTSTVDGMHAAGHAYAIVGVDLEAVNPDGTVGFFWVQNTWGARWGIKSGRAKMTFAVAGTLYMAGGEICLPTELRVKPKPAMVASAAFGYRLAA